MWTSCLSILPCAFGFLLSLHLVTSRPLEGSDNLSDVKNLPEESKTHGVNSAVSTLGDKNSPANSGPPGCCTPQLYLGFHNTTRATSQGLEGRRAQSPVVSSEKGPCDNYADLNTGHLQFKSANLANVTDAITIAVWVKLQSRLGIQPILVIKGEAGVLKFELFEGFITWRYSTTRPSLATFVLLSDTPVVPENVWTHLLVQYDAHTRRCAVFLNGEEILNGFSNGGSLEIAWGELTTIGKFAVNEELALKLNGFIDEFYIYHCNLPETVIRRLVQECHMEGKCSPLGPAVGEQCDVRYFQCSNGKCAKQEWRCDGENDCGDWSDEIGCDGFCGPGEQSSALQGQCVACYCAGRSQNCSHANVYRDRLTLQLKTSPRDPPVYLVDVTGSEVSGVKYTADHSNNELVAYNVSKETQFYWALPKEFLGNKLTSYGGKLRYSVKYSVDGKSRKDNTGSLSRLARIARDVMSSVNLEQEYFIDGNGDEEENYGSGLTTLDPAETTHVTKISTSGKITNDSQKVTTTSELPSSDSTESVTSETVTTIPGSFSLETVPVTRAQDETPTSESSTAYATDRPTKELAPSTAMPDSVSTVAQSWTTGEVETTATIPDTSSIVTDDSTGIQYETTDFVSSSVYSTESPTARTSTTMPKPSSMTTVVSTESQEETTTAYSIYSRVAHSSTDDQDEITTAATLEYSTDTPTTETLASTPDSYTDVQYKQTTLVPRPAKSTESSTSTYTAISDGSSTATDASAKDQGETTTALHFSTYSVDEITTEAPTTVPELRFTENGANGEITVAMFTSAYTTDTPNTETATVIPRISSRETHSSTVNQEETTTTVPTSSFSTVMPTTEEPTVIMDAFSTATDGSTTSVSPSSGFSTEEDTIEVSTTTPDSLSLTRGAERSTMEASSTMSFISSTRSDVSTTGQGKTIGSMQYSSYSSEIPSSEPSTVITDDYFPVTGSSTQGQGKTSTVVYSKVSISDLPTTSPTAMSDTSVGTITSAEGDEETTTVVSSSTYSAITTTKDETTAIPETFAITTDVLTEEQDETTEAEYETTTFGPSSPSGTDTSASVTTIPSSFISVEDASSDGQHETSTVESSTPRSTDGYTIEASTTSPDTSSTAGGVMIEDETTSFAPFSTSSTDQAGGKETTTILYETSTVTDVASAPDDTATATPRLTYNTHGQTTGEAFTAILDASSVATDASKDTPYETTTVVFSSSDSTVGPTAEETTTFVFPSSYSTDKASSDETTAIADTSSILTDPSTSVPGETTTVIPSSVVSTNRQTTEVFTDIPNTSTKETDSWTEFTDGSSTAVPPSVDGNKRATPGEPSTTIPDTYSIEVNLSTEEQDEMTTIYSTKMPTTETSSTPITEISTASEDTTKSYLSSLTHHSPRATSEAVTTPVTTTITDTLTEGQDETTTFELSFPYSTDTPTTEASTQIIDTVTYLSTKSNETMTVVFPLSYNTDTPTAEGTTTTSDSSSLVTDTTTLGQDQATTARIPVTPAEVTDVSALKESTVMSSSAYSTDKQTTDERTEPHTLSPVIDASTKSQDEETIVLSSPSYSTDRPTTTDTAVTLDKYSTITAVTTVSQKTTTAVESSSSPSSEAITPTSESVIRCRFGDKLYPINSTFVTESCKSRCSCLKDGNHRCVPLCTDDPPICNDGEMVVGNSLPVENSSCLCVVESCEKIHAPTARTSPSVDAEAVRLVGKDTTLVFHHAQPSSGNSQTTMEVSLTEGLWRSADGAQTSRDTFIRVLSDVQAIYVRASYNGDDPKTLSIVGLSLDVASEQDSGFGKAMLVEQCECPVGYSGLSCESCKPGYYRSRVDEVSEACIKCDCHGHSEDGCDPETGQCKNCKHNSEGTRCERCLSGYYGNATIGTPSDCKACPCPVTSPPGRVSPTCFMAEDGQPTCDACPPGYGGRRCEKCVTPYEGDPTEAGGKCKISESLRIDCGCDTRGSVNNSCDPLTRQCYCKKHVEGLTCDKCKRSFFNLQSDEPDGCVACFCFGVSKDCKCADYYKDIIRISFALIEGPEFLRLSDLGRQTIISNGFQVKGDPQHFVYDKFDKLATDTYYWFLGKEFRGDLISSYEGVMRYTVSHEMNPGGKLTSETDMQITGRGLVLKYRHGRRLEGGNKGLYGLRLSEDWLRFPDGGRVTRDNVMTVLSAVDSILIRATYSTTTTRASLYDVTLEKGVPQVTRFGKLENIEDCSCPPEYTGTSCQHCAQGYTRSYPGPAFSPCVSCSCNQHSKECDPENGQCVRCDHNTTGSQCDKCSVGFYGDPTKGTPKDCQPCPCPLTVASNQFSRICKLESDGNPACTACQTGYTGRNCERCARGYAGNPSNLGEKCVKIPVDFLPAVRVRPMKRIREEGDDALFYCFAGGQPRPTFAWSRKDGQPMSRRVFVKGKRLRIRGVKKEDEGTYLCTARNVYGSEIASGRLIVKARLEDPIVVSVSPKVLHVPVNQSAQFTCKAKSATDSRLKWTRGMYGALPEGAVSVNGVLSIQKTQRIHGGTYTCTGKNAFSDDMATVQLRVGVTSPQVFISPSRLSVREGDTAQFRCSASGFPAPVLQWHGSPGSGLPREAEISNGNGTLTFVKVKESHEGEYFCTASNLGGGTSSTSAFLNVSAAGSVPVISVSPNSLTVLEGEEALFQCTATGDPAPIIHWSREIGNFSESSSSENGVLRIITTKPEDEGAYVCTAANSFGARAFLVNLRVERDTSVAPTALVQPVEQTVDEGASTFLSCQVTGEPYPSMKWSKVGGALTDNHVIEEGLLRIKEMTKDDEGMYVCVAQNKKGVEQATGIVNVRSE